MPHFSVSESFYTAHSIAISKKNLSPRFRDIFRQHER